MLVSISPSRFLMRHGRSPKSKSSVIDYRLGDAEALQVGDAEFNAVISTFGVAPDQERAASELARSVEAGDALR